jgi:hypothetical protein
VVDVSEREALWEARPQYVKDNALRLADHHREHCDGPDCTVSLVALAELLILAGFELSDDETRRLL